MHKITLPKINYRVEPKSYLPAILALMITSTIWYFSGHFSSEPFRHQLTIQITFFLANFMVNFLTLDQLTNRSNFRLIAPLAIIPVAIFVILLLSKQRYVSFLGLLTMAPLISMFFPFKGKNGIGLISLAISWAILAPVSFYYIRNSFVSSMLLKLGILVALTFVVILFSVFIDEFKSFSKLFIGLLVIILILAIILLRQWSVMIYPILGVVGLIISRIKLPANFILLLLIILSCVTMIFTALN